jgi:hypothetical protein
MMNHTVGQYRERVCGAGSLRGVLSHLQDPGTRAGSGTHTQPRCIEINITLMNKIQHHTDDIYDNYNDEMMMRGDYHEQVGVSHDW